VRRTRRVRRAKEVDRDLDRVAGIDEEGVDDTIERQAENARHALAREHVRTQRDLVVLPRGEDHVESKSVDAGILGANDHGHVAQPMLAGLGRRRALPG
jgi:hypothetical protein